MREIVPVLLAVLCLAATPSAAGPVRIESRVADGGWRVGPAVEALRGEAVSLRVKPVPAAEIRWFQIIPNIAIRYNNAVWPWLPGAYTWKGYDEIEYRRVHLARFDGTWQIEVFSKDARAQEDGVPVTRSGTIFGYLSRRFLDSDAPRGEFFNEQLGSFWYQAEVRAGGRTHSTPGIEAGDQRGLSPQVFRVSVKSGDDLLGNLTSYFNVPAVFGSTPYQVANHIGVDCADVLMAAYADYNGVPISKDYNVAMLTSKFRTLVRSEVVDGRPETTIHWGKDVRAGDFIAVRYPGGRQYQHIGALYRDQNENGLLDEADLVLHAGPDPLHWSELRAGQFDGAVVILRPI